MKKHIKIYFDSLRYPYDPDMYHPCEICGGKMVDVHHIEARGMGGSKLKDTIENLMGLCRKCHEKYGDKKQYLELLKRIHNEFLTLNI